MCSAARLFTSRSLRACTSRELVLQVADAVADEPAVAFELRFARAAQADAAALLARQVGPHLLQARQRVFELREFDLQPRLGRLGAGGEDVEDQLAAVEHLDADAPSRGCAPGPGERSLSKMTTSASVDSTSS